MTQRPYPKLYWYFRTAIYKSIQCTFTTEIFLTGLLKMVTEWFARYILLSFAFLKVTVLWLRVCHFFISKHTCVVVSLNWSRLWNTKQGLFLIALECVSTVLPIYIWCRWGLNRLVLKDEVINHTIKHIQSYTGLPEYSNLLSSRDH